MNHLRSLRIGIRLTAILVFIFFFQSLFAQQERQAVIRGSVKDSKGDPVAFATVYIKETQQGTQSDAEGNFLLRGTPGSYTFCVQFMGYETHEQPVTLQPGERTTISVELAEMRYALQEVLVESKSSVQRVSESAFNVVAVDVRDLHNTTQDLSNVLDKISGVRIRQSGGVGSDTRLTLNGFSGRHVKLFMDGVPMESFGSSFQINNIPVNLADRIEVYKGVVPIEFGADALGGAINIVTRQNANSYLDVSYSFGSFNTHKSNISFAKTTKSGFNIQFNAYQNYSDNSYRVRTELLDLEDGGFSGEDNMQWFKRFHDNYHNETVVAKAGVVNKPWADRLLFGIMLGQEFAEIQHSNLMRIVYGGRHRRAKSIIPSLNYKKNNLFTDNLHFSLTANYSHTVNNNVDTLARQYNWLGEYRTTSYIGEGAASLGEFTNKSGVVTANLNYKIGDRHTLSMNNVFTSYSRTSSDILASGNSTSTAADTMRRVNTKNVIGASYRYDATEQWNISLIGKHYNVKVIGPVDVSTSTDPVYEEQKRTFSVTGYGITSTYLWNAFRLKASYEKAFRLPSETELFGDGILETGTTTIRPEKSDNLNLNVIYNATVNDLHSIYFDIGFVYRLTHDYIRRQIEQRYGGAYYTNHGKVLNLGIDAEARYSYGDRLTAGGSLTYQEIKDKEKYDIGGRELISYNQRMPNIPYLFGNFDVSYFFHDVWKKGTRLALSYNLNYVEDFYRNYRNVGSSSSKIIIPGHVTHDASMTYILGKGKYNLTLEARNITDEIVYDNYMLQKPGRSFAVKLRYFLFQDN